MKVAAWVAFVLLSPSAFAQHSETKRTAQGHPLGCRPSSSEAAEISACFQQLNQYRQAQGRSALAYDQALEEAMEGHCHHMVVHNFFSHNGPAGEPETARFTDRARACGTTASGENIAWGQRNASAVMNSWRNSPGHNANMLNSGYTRVGIGCYLGGRSPYWGQLFGRGAVTRAQPNQPPPPAPPQPNNPPPAGTPPASNNPPPPANNNPNPALIGNPTPSDPGTGSSGIRQDVPRPPKRVPAGMLKR
jgi:uncharacterized protein YkwD